MANLRWAGWESVEAIADARLRCYGAMPSDRPAMLERTKRDRFADGDVLLATDSAGVTIGTATHLPFSVCGGGVPMACQGVAWVGTARSHRRRRDGEARGIASRLMTLLLDRARERGDVVSALMPFRASFYEHFGYGVVERQAVWTVPLSILPTGDTGGFAEATDDDVSAMARCRSRQAANGNCDLDGGVEGVQFWRREWSGKGFTFVDRTPMGAQFVNAATGVADSSIDRSRSLNKESATSVAVLEQNSAVLGFLTVQNLLEADRMIALVEAPAYDSLPALKRLLAFLGTLRDQYSAARIHLPVDLPLNMLLSERQIPHRRVDHPAASCRIISRMQLRVLDAKRWLESRFWPVEVRGRAVLAIAEPEGGFTKVAIDVEDGRAAAASTDATADVTVSAADFATVTSGAASAKTLAAMGVIEAADDGAVELLDGLSGGSVPYCWEYF